MASEGEDYHVQDALAPALRATGLTGGMGLFVASVQATLTKQNIGFLGTFTRYGSTVATFGAFEFTRLAAANLRGTNDTYNHAIGGFFSGSMIGLKFRSLPAIFGYGAGLSIIMAAYQYTGGSLDGFSRDESIDEYARKEALRKNRRRPIQETLEELGEGRGWSWPTSRARMGKVRDMAKNWGVCVSNQEEQDVETSSSDTGTTQRKLTAYNLINFASSVMLGSGRLFGEDITFRCSRLHDTPMLKLSPRAKANRHSSSTPSSNSNRQIDSLKDIFDADGGRADAIENCLASIAKLSDNVKDAVTYTPAYDQRTYSELIKKLISGLDTTRTAVAPRPKFSFKNRKMASASISTQSAIDLKGASQELETSFSNSPHGVRPADSTTPSTPSGSKDSSTSLQPPRTGVSVALANSNDVLEISNVFNRCYDFLPIKGNTAYSSVVLTGVSRTFVDLRRRPVSDTTLEENGKTEENSASPSQDLANVSLRDITSSLIITGPVSGPIHMTNVKDSILLLSCRQFRMHESHNTNVYTYCASHPIIEACSRIFFHPLPSEFGSGGSSPREEIHLGGFTDEEKRYGKNMWSNIDDFDWLKSEPSPNFHVMNPQQNAEGGSILEPTTWPEMWTEIVADGTDDTQAGRVGEFLVAVGLQQKAAVTSTAEE
ncbi:hypothetical protein FH972_022639 [Carpinus fangiana]|uniref:C-CAP/cofactor C-like domain-containing protein n=1 Tax=Carpinus fangiana TaxID=176857 RepID=A0A5N6KTC5_9ROSI|nr:hypothetical protein FH972_022639 [Carpinus fangiana]